MGKKIDWKIHYVFADQTDAGYYINAHTHGLNKHNHPELMISLPLSKEVCCEMLNSIGLRILNGERFDKEEIRFDIIESEMPVKIIKENFGSQLPRT